MFSFKLIDRLVMCERENCEMLIVKSESKEECLDKRLFTLIDRDCYEIVKLQSSDGRK